VCDDERGRTHEKGGEEKKAMHPVQLDSLNPAREIFFTKVKEERGESTQPEDLCGRTYSSS